MTMFLVGHLVGYQKQIQKNIQLLAVPTKGQYIFYDTAIVLPGIYLIEMSVHVYEKMYTVIFTTALYVVAKN